MCVNFCNTFIKSLLNLVKSIWAALWQNQQNHCAPSGDSDQPGHPPSLIRVFSVRMKKAWALSYPLNAQRRLIRLGGCPGWSESSLGTQSFCWFCHKVAQICFSIWVDGLLIYFCLYFTVTKCCKTMHQSFVTLAPLSYWTVDIHV